LTRLPRELTINFCTSPSDEPVAAPERRILNAEDLTFSSSFWQGAVFCFGPDRALHARYREAQMENLDQRHTSGDKSAEEALREVLAIESQAQAIIEDAQKEAKRILSDAEARARELTQAAQERALEEAAATARAAAAQAEQESRALVTKSEVEVETWALQAETRVGEAVERVLQAITLGVIRA
jgi:vacuolar-type H+-ATPase subunit H